VLRRRVTTAVPPEILPGYAELSELGTVPLADAYRAVELDTGRYVVLQVLRVDTSDRDAMVTVESTITALRRITGHPNIVTLHRTASTPDGRPVLVLSDCAGSLADRLERRGAVDARSAVRIGIKLAGALETAHGAGIVHGDLRPQNVLFTELDEPVISGLGLSSLAPLFSSAEGISGFKGFHAAPELLEGGRPTPSADVYGLASVMHEMLTGSAAFEAFDDEPAPSVILRILRDPARPPRGVGIPAALGDLLESAMDKDPARRPLSAASFGHVLEEIDETSEWATETTEPVVHSVPDSQPSRGRTLDRVEGLTEAAGLTANSATTRPSLEPPRRARRSVVTPRAGRRGPPSSTLRPPAEPLLPLEDVRVKPRDIFETPSLGTRAADPARTRFSRPPAVDPSPPADSGDGHVSPPRQRVRTGMSKRGSARSAGRLSAASPAELIGLALAAVVVVVAVLLVAGVL
jgi:serine/threonine protein kinase